jgi:chromatin structure-remodeling complex subunit RSC1/2
MLPDHINAVIPEEVRKRFHRDAFGRILFFTAPPLDTQSQGKPKLGHSLKYLAKKARDEEAKRAKLANQDATARNDHANGTDGKKRVADEIATAETEVSREIDQQHLEAAMLPWLAVFDEGTNQIFKDLYGSQWQEVKNAQMAEAYGRIEAMQKRAVQEADGNPAKRSRVML